MKPPVRRWNRKDDEQLLELYYRHPKLKIREIAEIMETTYGAIKSRLVYLNVERRKPHKRFSVDELEYIRVHCKHKSYKQLARDLNRDPNSIRTIAHRHGFKRLSEDDTKIFVAFVDTLLEETQDWHHIAERVNAHFGITRTKQAVYQRWWHHRKKRGIQDGTISVVA